MAAISLAADPGPRAPISVVVTCYNLERFIGEAIESVLAQRDAPPFEVVVVDDCSTDRSAEIIRGFGEARYVRTPSNGGVLLASLAGVEQAKHDVVCLLDGDDLWEPGKLAATGAVFDTDQTAALVTHDLCYIDESGRPINRRSRPGEELTPLDPANAADRVRQGILELDDYVWLGSALSFRRSLARWDEFAQFAAGLPDPRNCYQDWPLAYWIAALPDVRMTYVAEPLFRYRLHGHNYSGDARTIERAVRNFTRARNTRAAMAAIAERRSLPTHLKRIVRQSVGLADAQADLYAGRRLRALAGFTRSLPLAWRDGILAREAVRFGIGALISPSALMRLGARPESLAPGR